MKCTKKKALRTELKRKNADCHHENYELRGNRER